MELSVASWHKDDSTHVLDHDYLASESHVQLCLQTFSTLFLWVKRVEQVGEASWERILSHEEVPDIAKQHANFALLGERLSILVEVDIVREESPEDGEVFMSG